MTIWLSASSLRMCLMCVKAHELIAKQCPLSASCRNYRSRNTYIQEISNLLSDWELSCMKGIGNTIRVSLTGDPVEEIKYSKADS